MARKSRKFKYKILIIFLLVSILPLLAISVSNLFLVIKTRQQNIIELQNLAVNNVKEKTIKYLNQKIENLHCVFNFASHATTTPIRQFEDLDPNSLVTVFSQVHNFLDNSLQTRIIDKNDS